MKIAICSMGELFGGVERQILDLCRYLQRRDLPDPLVILFFERELAAQLREQGLEPVIIRGRTRYDPAIVGRVASLLVEQRIDVVHAHGYKAAIACGMAARRAGCRVVKTEHGKLEASPTRPLAWAKAHLNFALEQWFTRRRVDHICYVTHDIAVFHADHHRGLEQTVIHNGIDALEVGDYGRPDDLPTDRFNVGIVGRVTQIKGIPLAIQAMARHDLPPQIMLQIIGDGPQRNKLELLVKELGVADRVRFLGFRRNVFNYLAHLDALLMPSYHEGLPYTLLEAMSLSRPVVGARVGGLQEVLCSDETGILVDVGSVEGIAAALRRLVTEPQLARNLGEAARREQTGRLTLDAMGKAYLECYR